MPLLRQDLIRMEGGMQSPRAHEKIVQLLLQWIYHRLQDQQKTLTRFFPLPAFCKSFQMACQKGIIPSSDFYTTSCTYFVEKILTYQIYV